jgi:two-component system, OmpR family, phosphate regulon sensor histidine kinase PhoR
MNRHSLFLRLFLGNLLIVGLVVGTAGAIAYNSLNTSYQRDLFARQDQMAAQAAQYVEHVWSHTSPEEMDRLCKDFPKDKLQTSDGARPLTVRLTVIAEDGRVLGDSDNDPAAMVNHKTADRPEILAALEGKPGTGRRHSGTQVLEFRYAARPVMFEGRVVAVARVATPVVAVAEEAAATRNILLWTIGSAIVVCTLIGLLVNWIWYVPLRRLNRAARRLSAGDLENRIHVGGAEELVQLGQALNEMRQRLAEHIRTVTAQRESLQQVISSLHDGLIALDSEGKIVLANSAAVDLLSNGETDVAGRHLQSVVRTAAIIDAYNATMASGRAIARQVEIDVRGRRRHIDIRVEPVLSGAESIRGLIVVRDVTDLVRLAAVKTEFVANASHELRTPLATLRAAVESLQAADPADHEAVTKLAAMLERHVRRLEGLTLDLLDLHKAETVRGLSVEEVTLDSLGEWVRREFTDPAIARQLTLGINVSPEGESFDTDRQLVQLILRNLLENALKFTPEGGRVECTIRREAKEVRLIVTDTGIGIRPEDRSRVFDRFFQSDAARSGDTAGRGTGLGLAIVKHACERLGAQVQLESELGKGTTVTVSLSNQ